jgi:hypothetical protein
MEPRMSNPSMVAPRRSLFGRVFPIPGSILQISAATSVTAMASSTNVGPVLR